MTALILDANNTPNLVTQPTRSSDQYFSPASLSPTIVDDKASDKVGPHFASHDKSHASSFSSFVIMNSDRPHNLTCDTEIRSNSNQEPGDVKSYLGVEQHISETSKKKISEILNGVSKLKDIEKLYLYLQLPDGSSNNSLENDAKKKGLYNPFGKKADAEIVQTYTWIQSHLEEDISVSIPKHEVYEEYRAYCEANRFEKLCVADFGKAMKHIFPQVKPRRLGQRGNSKYCYSGLRKKILVGTPELPVLDTSEYKYGSDERDNSKKAAFDNDIVWNVILDWVEKTFNRKFKTSIDFARYLIETQNIKTDLACAFKNNQFKVNNMAKNLSPKSQSIKKKDVCNQITKKLQEKKKCDTNNINNKNNNDNNNAKTDSDISPNTTSNHTPKSNTNSKTTNISKVNDNKNLNGLNTSHLIIKSEIDDTAFSKCNYIVSPKMPLLLDKSSIPPSPTLVTFSGNHSSLNDSTITSVDSTSSSSNNNNNNIIKYKSNPPKAINLGLSTNECFDLNSTLLNNNTDKRRHSVATPFNFDSNNVQIKKEQFEEFKEFGSELKLSLDNDKNYKRQIDEKDLQFMTKKRHLDMGNHSSAQNTANNIIKASNLMSNLNLTLLENSDLKVNEIETEALFDYLNTSVTSNSYDNSSANELNLSHSNGNENAKDSFVQIRKLLENHLSNSYSNDNCNQGIANPNKNNQETLPNTISSNYIDNSNSNSLNCIVKPNYQYNDNSLSTSFNANNEVNNNIDINNGLVNNGQIQIPPSPNARRRAFSFQPISPRNTPTIPENSALDMNIFNNKANFNDFNSSQYKQMNAIAVGTSQPSSEANSPFVSPRNTPISLGSNSRSRNNSGQSTYSNFRQTSLQNFDSGVSSISTSPFISPQSTPIPVTTRMRTLEGPTLNRNFTRARHSSGPGGPINRSQISNVMLYNRSNSLSPMIGTDNAFVFSNQNLNQSLSLNPNSNSSNNKIFNDDFVNKLNIANQNEPKLAQHADSHFQFPFNSNMDSNLSCKSKSILTRQRHFSNPYGGTATNMMKSSEEHDPLKMLLNRSQSVPLHQMFESNIFNPTNPIECQLNDYSTANLLQTNETTNAFSDLERNIPKPYPTTSICNESFKLPHQTSIGTGAVPNAGLQPNNGILSTTLEDLLTSNDSVIQSGQDLIVSSVQINQGINTSTTNNESNQPSSVDELNVPSPLTLTKSDRDEFNDLLISDTDVDHFQTLDHFRDCDNEFSNIDLENQTNSYDDDFIKFN